MRPRSLLAALALAAAWAAGPAASAQVQTGGPLPLADVPFATAQGATATLGASAGPSGLLVVFWSNTCPWSDRYRARLSALAGLYRPAGLGVVLVNGNDPAALESEGAAGSLDELQALGLDVPYLLDADGRLRVAFAAQSAPHAFLFDAAGALLYDGAIDDSPSSLARVERHYLTEALDQSVGGLPVAVQRTQAFGCRYPKPPAAPGALPVAAPPRQ